MRKIKRPKIGQYVLVAKYSDKSPLDPWRVGFVTEIIIRENLVTCKVDTDIREWHNIWNITKEEGAAWLEAHLTKHAPDVVESAALNSISPASEVSASEAESKPATTQVM